MIYTLFQNSPYRFFYSVDGKSYDPRLIISYQPRCFYEFYCKGFHKTKTVLLAFWPLSGFSRKCGDEKMSVERSQSRTGNSIVRGIPQVNVTLLAAVFGDLMCYEEKGTRRGRDLNNLILIITHIKFSVNKIMLTVKLQSFCDPGLGPPPPPPPDRAKRMTQKVGPDRVISNIKWC